MWARLLFLFEDLTNCHREWYTWYEGEMDTFLYKEDTIRAKINIFFKIRVVLSGIKEYLS